MWDKSEGKAGLFGRSDFTWEAEEDRYICPSGKSLLRNRYKSKNPGQITKANTIIYRASKRDCDVCPLKPKYCPTVPGRKTARSIHEDARDLARDLAKTRAYQQSQLPQSAKSASHVISAQRARVSRNSVSSSSRSIEPPFQWQRRGGFVPGVADCPSSADDPGM